MLKKNQSALFEDAGLAAVKPETKTAGAADASTLVVAQCGVSSAPIKI